MVDIVAIALSGIEAAQQQLAITASNIANASNPNYSVESVEVAAVPGTDGGSAGVQVLGVRRATVPFVNPQINHEQAAESYATAFSQIVQTAETYLAPQSGPDLAQSIQDLLNQFLSLSGSPEDLSLREGVLTSAQQLAQQSQSIDSGLANVAGNALAGLPATVAQVNDYTAQLAKLNFEITQASSQGVAGGATAAALLDQRDSIAQSLAGLIGAQMDSQGNVSLGGVPLVSGSTSFNLSLVSDSTGNHLEVNLPYGVLTPPNNTVGGQVGGILNAIDAVSELRQRVNHYIDGVASAINSQQALGYDLNGNPGGALFVVPSGDGPIAMQSGFVPDNFAAASSPAGVPGDGSNAAAIGQIQNLGGVDSDFPNANAQQAWAQLTADFGLTVETANTQQTQAQALLQSLEQLKTSVTGVSVNQELTQMLEYLNTLQAAGRAVSVGLNLVEYLIQNL